MQSAFPDQTIHEVAANANSAAGATSNSLSIAAGGKETVVKTVQGMEEIAQAVGDLNAYNHSVPAAERTTFQSSLGKLCSGDAAQVCKDVGLQSLTSTVPAALPGLVKAY